MKKVLVLAIIAVLLAGMAAFAADTKAMGVGKTQNVTFIEAVKVAGTVLKAGDYRVQHVMEGDKHLLVFKSDKGKEVARAACTMVELPKKADQTLLGFNKEESGDKTLNFITFRGETFRHQL